MANTTLPLTGLIAEYYGENAYREPLLLAELRKATAAATGGDANMQIAPEQGAFMGMIAALMNAREILEIGTFTGYSSLAMLLASKADITCVDVSEEFTSIAREHWKKAGVESRVTLRLDGGHAAIADLLVKGRAASFDLCFIDADKTGYDAYYEGALKLLRPGGLIMIDNVLWGGEVADPAKTDDDTQALRKLNAKIKSDARVAIAMVPIGDGLTLARKV
jgi:predicted O-methyltransferase YrrM